jgi:hypothetical protein
MKPTLVQATRQGLPSDNCTSTVACRGHRTIGVIKMVQ